MACLASFTDHADIAVFPPQQGENLLEAIRQSPQLHGLVRSRWRLADLIEVVPGFARYTLAGMSKALKRLGVHRVRGRLKVHSPDLAYQIKCEWVQRAVETARQEPERVSVVYGDEFSLYRQPTLSEIYGLSPDRVGVAELSHRSNTRQRISGALDVVTGRVVWTEGSKMGVKKLCQFLEWLRAAYERRELFLVWDNWPVHQHPKVLTKATELEIRILWLPTYAPWTNYIEKLWRWIKQELLHHHGLADRWEELKARVADFLNQFDQGSTELLQYVGVPY